MTVPYTKADVCWCDPFDAPKNPECPMHKENDMKDTPVNDRCTFAYPGTYGHDCGNPATSTAVIPSKRTRSGFYYGGRCDKHAYECGGDNAGIEVSL